MIVWETTALVTWPEDHPGVVSDQDQLDTRHYMAVGYLAFDNDTGACPTENNPQVITTAINQLVVRKVYEES